MADWILCTERMPDWEFPKEVDYVLVDAPARGVDLAFWDGERWHWRSTGYAIPSEIVAWQPLPAALPRHLYQNSEVIYVACSAEHAAALLLADMDGDESYTEGDPFVLIPDDQEIEVCSDEQHTEADEQREVKNPAGAIIGYVWCENKRASQWVEGWYGVGHFSGGDY